MGVIGSTLTVLLAGNVVFAQDRATSTPGANRGEGYRAEMASSTKARMEAAREAAQTRVEAQREKVAQRLLDIQDKVKQQLAERIASQFDTLNEKWTDHFMNLLDRYDALLGKVQSRRDIAEANGKDVTAVDAAIESAETAITDARTAVTAQAATTYTFDPSTIPATATGTPSGQERLMQSLRQSFQALHTGLFQDLFALRDGVMKDARSALQNALQTLGQISGVDDE